MKVIVNAISAHTGGIVTYTSNLVKSLRKFQMSAEVCVPVDYQDGTDEAASSVSVRYIDIGRYPGPIRFLWEQIAWRWFVKKSGAKVLFSSANYGVLAPPIKQVLLVQGEISFNPVYQDRVLPRLSFTERLGFALRRKLVQWSARNSAHVVYPSQTSLDSVVEGAPSTRDRSVVNYLAVDKKLVDWNHSRAWKADGQLKLIYVSVYYPHKDPQTLADAVRRLNDEGLSCHAWITMESIDFWYWSTGAQDLPPLLDAQVDNQITLGRLDHAHIGEAFDDHDVMVYPSFAETFGFPLVEAMAVGIPVVAADTPIHREICGDAVLYFAPGDPEDLGRVLRKLDGDAALRADLRKKGKARVGAMYSWENHMSRLVDLIEKAAA